MESMLVENLDIFTFSTWYFYGETRCYFKITFLEVTEVIIYD